MEVALFKVAPQLGVYDGRGEKTGFFLSGVLDGSSMSVNAKEVLAKLTLDFFCVCCMNHGVTDSYNHNNKRSLFNSKDFVLELRSSS